jgi:prepilin-type N-terminal cleavage/methylation domain-containing protein
MCYGIANERVTCHTGFMKSETGSRRRWLAGRGKGFTLFEILIVISILLLILVLVLINLQTQLMRARDSQRKTDLANLQKSYEEYFNDKQCYPYEEILETCSSDYLAPYMKKVPCDPTTKTPYIYVPGAPTLCSGYRICAKLENTHDPDIVRLGCDPVTGCGWVAGYNYCVSAGFDVAKTPDNADTAGNIGGPSPTPTPTPIPGTFACTKPQSGNPSRCSSYGDPGPPPGGDCPVTYADRNCLYNGVDQCQFAANWCRNY